MKRFYIPATIFLFTGFAVLGFYGYLQKEKVVGLPHASVATSTIETKDVPPQYEIWKTVARRLAKPEDVPKYDLDKDTGIITRYSGLNDNSFKQYPPCGSIYVNAGDSIMDTLQKETIDDLYRTSNPWFGQADIQFGVNVESLSPEMRQIINKGGSNLIIRRVEDPTPDNFCTRWKILGTTSQSIIEHRSVAGALPDDFGFVRSFETTDLSAYYGRLLVDLPGGYKEGNIKFDCETVLVNAEDSPISSWAWFSPDYKQYLNIDPQKLTAETLSAIRASTKEHPVKLHITKVKDIMPLEEHTQCEQRGYTIDLAR